MLPSILAKEIIKGLQAYVVTGFETPTPFFKGIFSDLVKTPGRFYKGPSLGLQLPFQSGEAGKDFWLFDVSCGFQYGTRRAGNHVDHGHKSSVVSIASGSRSGCLEQAV